MVGNDDLSSSSVSSRSTLCDIDDLSLSPRFLTGHLWYTGSLVVYMAEAGAEASIIYCLYIDI